MRHHIITEDLFEISNSDLKFDALAGQTILVTGANGFLPAYMIETLLFLNETKNLGARIIGLIRNEEKAKERFKYYEHRNDFTLVKKDLREELIFSEPVDLIIHAASQASPKYYGIDPVGTLAPNVIGTYRLLELARQKKSLGFFYFSSSEVYGQIPGSDPINEKNFGFSDCLQVRSCYSESKRMGETMCISWSHQYGIPVKIVRPFHTYGPGMATDDGRVFADFVADIVAKRNIVMKSDGQAIRAYCYLADATRAFFTVLLKGENCTAYNVGNDEAQLSVIDLADTLVELFPERNLRVERWTENRGQGYLASSLNRLVPDTSKLRALGWRPTHSIPDGFKRTVMSYQ